MIIELTDEQAYIIRDSLELYARIRTGDFEQIWNTLVWDCEKNGGVKGTTPNNYIWHNIVNILKELWFPNLNNNGGYSSNWGVGHDKPADKAWTIMEVIRYYLAHKNYPLNTEENNREIVDHYKPTNWANFEKLPVIREE